MIDQRFMDLMAQDMIEDPELSQQDIQLASANTGVTTDGYQPPLYRLNMPKGLNTRENMDKQSNLIANTLAGQTRGVVQGFGGIGGDLETVGRMALNVLGFDVSEDAALITSEDIAKKLESLGVSQENISALIDKAMPNQAGSATAEEKATAFGGGETLGEVIAPGGQLKLLNKIAKPVIGATKKIVEMGKDLPVGMGIKAVDESLDPLGFYSAASKAVDNIQQPKGTGAQFLAQIEKTPGVKKEELLWTGLDEFLAGKKSVTKSEVQDYLNTNRVEVKEVTLGSGPNPYPYRTADEWQDAIDRAEKAKDFDESERLTNAWEAFEGFGIDDQTKFAKYTLPGGENYREVLLTLPTKMLDKNSPEMIKAATESYGEGSLSRLSDAQWSLVSNRVQSTPEFKSQHFDQPNVLAHMRLNDRVDADGKKVLFVEEIQSDWHQAGRKKGYAQDVSKQLEKINEERALLVAEKSKVLDEAKPFTDQGMDAPSALTDRFTMADDRLTALQNMQNKLGNGVPDAPFKTSWHELSLKRAIQLASEGGYDRIAFTTGKTQAERYDLSKQISRVTYKDEILRAYDKDGVEVISNLATPDKLEDYVGKELASKIIADNDKLRIANKNYRDAIKNDVPDAELNNLSREVGSFPMEYKGVDLAVGGEGMKGFYDTILPKYLDKYGKKWDAKVGTTKIRLETDAQAVEDAKLLGELGVESNGKSAASVHYMDITPKMRESVLTKGQPLFQAAPVIPAGAAASQQEENK